MNIEEIDAHVEAHLAAAVDETDVHKKLCDILHAARPIIKFAKALLFWKPKWQELINKLLDAIDEACPVPQTPVA